MNELQDIYNVTTNYVKPKEHVTVAERNNRVIKEFFFCGISLSLFQEDAKDYGPNSHNGMCKEIKHFPTKG
jgi:hypothetical protein